MASPTQGEHAQTAAQVQRYKIGYPTDSWGERSSTPSGIPDHAGAWVRYADHAAELRRLHAQVAAFTAAPVVPKVALELPDGDTRTANVYWSEMRGDTLHLCISVGTPAQPAPQGGAYAMHQRVEELIEKESELRRVVEIIALGESANPVIDAGDELVALGYWDAGAVAALRASNGQAPAQPVALPSDRELQEIAMQAAWRHSREPDAPKYLPRSPVHAATWKPHAWVVAAMKDAIEAATQPKKDHHDELS